MRRYESNGFGGVFLLGILMWVLVAAFNFAFWGGLIYLVYRLFFKH